MDKQPLVCDTTVLLYLDRIGQLCLLQALFEPVCVPEPVRLELAMGRLLRPDTIDPSQLNWITPVSVDQSELDALPPNRLGRGERAVIAYARSRAGYWVGSDDRQARLLAERPTGSRPSGRLHKSSSSRIRWHKGLGFCSLLDGRWQSWRK